jgi:mono/diheme cytochrome c family protein
LVIGGLIVLIGLVVVAIYGLSNGRIHKRYTVNPPAILVPTDAAALAEGERLATIRGCNGCHGKNLGGDVMIDGVPGHIVAPNLTKGQGGIGNTYTDIDWARAIRHGIGKDGRGLWIMPAQDFQTMSDSDTGKIIAYVKSVPSVDNDLGKSSFGLLFRALLVTNQADLIAAEKIDHNATVRAPTPGITVAYGQYLATTCQGCHGPKLAGGPFSGSKAGEPEPANLTPAGELKNWREADFMTAIRTGKVPSGRQLNAAMPWQSFSLMTDVELRALWLYLQSLPSTPTGAR